jgi:hypothetical protein
MPLETVPEVIETLAREPVSAVVVPCPGSSINAFALARRLRGHPPVTLAGPLRQAQLFWAERNGCHCAPSLEAALQPATEKGPSP